MKIYSLFVIMTLTLGLRAQAQGKPVYLDESRPIEERVDDALRRMTLDEKLAVVHAQSKFSSAGVKRLGLPDVWTDDGPHGVRPDVLWDEWEQAGQTNDSCVAFPALTCLAATWNPQLARAYGESLGEEALYRNKNVMLAPGVNINRTPLNGRNFEYMGEDPWLASRIVVPYVQGLQSKGVAACVKHYALNNDEEYRHQVNVIVSDRALREIYLPAFEAAVREGGTWAIMGAYNLYNDQHNCHNEILLNRILKHEWGFDGVVVSDWGGTHNTMEAVLNGLDMEFGSWTNGLTWGASNAYDSYYLALPYRQLITEGKLTTKELDEKVRRVLRLMFRTTMNRQRPYGALCSEAHYEVARKVAQEGIVLLKNDRLKANGNLPLLPIASDSRILVVGENAIKMMTVGGGSSSLKAQHEVLPLDGLCGRFAHVDYARGYVGDTVQSYNGVTVGRSLYDLRTPEALRAEAVEKARQADVVVVVGGLNKADYQDCEGHDRRDYAMPYGQNELVRAILAVNPRVVFVNISGNAIQLPWVNEVPAIVQAWFLGSESGHAIADVLSGDVNPSGKLPCSWYARLEDCGAHATGSYPGTWREGKQIIDEEYKEDIFVGYRWLDRQRLKPLFAFGHGLSYTSFAITQTVADKTEMTSAETIAFTVSVKNTGEKAGATTVQLYVSDRKSSLPRPVKELKAFRKVFLQPGEQKDVVLTLDQRSLSFYDDLTQQWTAEAGDFEALIGFAADDIVKKVKFRLK
ncbi:MAG: glycoside hydrolase family 3 C-terminal domain-containing protein [Bacteroidaceae bacterium]|nr:glycoside hydrolase family 3 C-terminal domain-containing protein [Bacteroidaceae bacterium]